MGALRRVLKKSCEGSSMKALPKIIKSASTVQRILWVLALLVGLGIAGYQLVKLLSGYLDYATSVNIVTVEGTPPFPDVTVCHLDPMWTFRKLEDKLGVNNSYEAYLQRVTDIQKLYGSHSKEYSRLEVIKNLQGYLQNVPSINKEAKHLRDTLLLDCIMQYDWDPFPCFGGHMNVVNSSVFVDPYFGLCVTFQIIDEKVNGLSLVLYLDDPELAIPKPFIITDYTTTHTSMVGAQVTIHPTGSFPDMKWSSHHVEAGVDMAFDIEGTKKTELDEPYGSCISTDEAQEAAEAGKSGYDLNNYGYVCYRMCAKKWVIEYCNCIHVFYAKEHSASTPLCGHFESNISMTMEKINCAEDAMDELAPVYTDACTCLTPCERFEYKYTTKAIEWPHNTYHLSFYDQYIHGKSWSSKFKVYDELNKLAKRNETAAQERVSQEKLIQHNFAQIRILNHQKTFLHYSDTPLISPEALFGNIGGLLNLWVGITFITIIEIMDFVYQLITASNSPPGGEKRAQNGAN